MSQVPKTVVRYSRDFNGNLSVDPNGSWVLAADAAINEKRLMNHIDRVTAERDAALAELHMVRKAVPNSTLELVSLQQRLTAADERVDLLEGLLRDVQKSARKQDWAHGYPTLFTSIDAALKPAEGGGDEAVNEG